MSHRCGDRLRVTAAPEDATDGVTTPDAEGGAQAPEALTVEGFDMDRARSLIEGADMARCREYTLIEGLKAAQGNPDLFKGALEAARDALGY